MSSTKGQTDLTSSFAKFTDPHLILPMLDRLEDEQIFPAEVVAESKIGILKLTKMVDYREDVHKQLGQAIPEDIAPKREKLLKDLEEGEKKSQKMISLLEDVETTQKLIEDGKFNLPSLKESHGVTLEDVEALYSYGKLHYECGKYDVALPYLRAYRSLLPSLPPAKAASILFGILSCSILLSDLGTAVDDLTALKNIIEEPKFKTSAAKILQLRAWALHCAVFIFYNVAEGPAQLLEFVFDNSDRYTKVIQITAPHLLRYISVASVLTRSRSKDVTKLISLNSYLYSDTITKFMETLHISRDLDLLPGSVESGLDFEQAEKFLVASEQLLKEDYLLGVGEDGEPNLRSEFLRLSRRSLVETFCKIHSVIDIAEIATMLQTNAEEAEKFLVNYIAVSRLQGRVDSAKGQVVIQTQTPTVHQQISERVKNLTERASVIASNIDRESTRE